MLTALALLLSAPAPAAPASDHAAAVQAALDDDGGWQPVGSDRGVTVFSKEIPLIGLTAFKGVWAMPPELDPDRLFAAICDVSAHVDFSSRLAESTLLAAAEPVLHFYQVMTKAPLIARRYWMVHSVIYEDMGGVDGHHKRTWDALAPSLYPEARAAVSERYPEAVEITENHGSWEILPPADGQRLFVYRAVSDPGGNVPISAQNALTTRTLPDNMLRFVEAARQ